MLCFPFLSPQSNCQKIQHRSQHSLTAAHGPSQWQMNWLWLVWEETEGGREMEGLDTTPVPYHYVQSAGSAAVSKLKLTGSAVATIPLRSNMWAKSAQGVIRGLHFMSSATAKHRAVLHLKQPSVWKTKKKKSLFSIFHSSLIGSK